MFSIALVVFREVFEIALILGVLLAATRGLSRRVGWVWLGLAVGAVLSVLTAVFANTIASLGQGIGQEVMNALILLTAAFLIGWTVIWMARHGRQIAKEFNAVGQDVIQGKKHMCTLSIVIALAVLREGAEIVMFTYGALVTGTQKTQIASGAILGGVCACVIGFILYYGLMKVPTKKIFKVTSWMLIFLVAGMMSAALGFLAQAGVVPEIIPTLWDSSHILSQESSFGRLLNVLVGYIDRPSLAQVISYALTLGVMGASLVMIQRQADFSAKRISS